MEDMSVGTKFEYAGSVLEVVASNTCRGCFFESDELVDGATERASGCSLKATARSRMCASLFRKDSLSIQYKLVGE